MTLDTTLRGYLEERIDEFIKKPMYPIKIAQFSHVKSTADFALGVFYGQFIADMKDFCVAHNIKVDDSFFDDLFSLYDRRSHEVFDAIQRGLEKQDAQGNDI